MNSHLLPQHDYAYVVTDNHERNGRMQDAMQCNALLLTTAMDRLSDDMFKLHMADLSTVRALFLRLYSRLLIHGHPPPWSR